jgi:SAM-dependent methyltransferase
MTSGPSSHTDQGSPNLTGSVCPVCRFVGIAPTLMAREHMFGMDARFTYAECRKCLSLYLVDQPNDLAPFYPDSYYSFRDSASSRFPRLGYPVRATFSRLSLPLSRAVLAPALTRGIVPGWLNYLAGRQVSVGSSIFDVGCGRGDLLVAMSFHGFKRLSGIDAYLPVPALTNHGVEIRRQLVLDVSGSFDVLMLHHSLEHIAAPDAVLGALREHLAPGGLFVVRIPVARSIAWEEYGRDWVQLDPPRHLFIPSLSGFERLAERAGFILEDVVFDSDAFQFWGSELCRAGRPLVGVDPKVVCSPRTLRNYRKRANEANRDRKGDQAAFILRARSG